MININIVTQHGVVKTIAVLGHSQSIIKVDNLNVPCLLVSYEVSRFAMLINPLCITNNGKGLETFDFTKGIAMEQGSIDYFVLGLYLIKTMFPSDITIETRKEVEGKA